MRTDIDLVQPATATGFVLTATFGWSASGCAKAAKIKFFRRSGDVLTLVDERGPFDANLNNTVSLVPAVNVQEGDLIGVTRLTGCGSPATYSSDSPSLGYVAYSGDVEGTVLLTAGRQASNTRLLVLGVGSATESVVRVIPVVASTKGLFGSFYKTAVQIFNPASFTLSGRFVFHPAGASGSFADPSLSFSVTGGQTISYSDILKDMGQAGVGSLDLVLSGDYIPVVSARVFNDGGAAGTNGFVEDAIDTTILSLGGALLADGAGTGYVLGPFDTTRFRFNIGVRTFFAGATLAVTVRDSNGAVLGMKLREYPPTFLEQVDAATLTGGPLSANESVEIRVVGPGLAMVYGVTVDNTTNDPSIQFARGVLSNLDVHPSAKMSLPSGQ